MKKFISILLSIVMILSLVPTSAFAAEIGYVSLTVTKPSVNASPDFQATCDHDNYVVDTEYKNSVNGVFWYDETAKKALTASDRFVEGHSYTVTVMLDATTGNKFALDTGVGVHTAVSGSINGSSARVKLSGDSMLKIAVSYTFVIASKLSSVSVTDIIVPVAGQKPKYEGIVSDDGYQLKPDSFDNFQNGVYWFDITESKLMKDGDTFIEGHQYRVFLCLISQSDEYEFKTNASGNPELTAYVNGDKAKAMKHLNNPAKNLIDVYYDFPACSKPQITSLTINNLPIPQAGKSPEYAADIESEGLVLADVNNTFVKNGIFWSHKMQGYDLTPSDFFYGEHLYVATLKLDVKPEYELKQPIVATVNGKSADATVSGGQVIVKYEVACPEYKVDKVDIKGVTVPAIGNSPSKDMQCAEPNLYVIKNVSWYVDNSLMSAEDKFIAGKNYDLEAYVDINKVGWDYVAEFADKVEVTVNGIKVSEKKVERIGNSVKFTYTFTAAASAKIGAVDIIGIDEPVAGKSPDYTAEVENSDTYMIDTSNTDRHSSNGILWRNVTSGNAMTVGAEKFEKGNVYEVMVTVTPHKGYHFVTKADKTADVLGTINGKTATDIMGRSDVEAIIVYRFPVCEEAPEVPENTDKPQSPETPAETEKPTQTEKPTEPENPTQPEKPTEPENPTQPEKPDQTEKPQETPKTSFVDVEKGQYYYDAVMWAAENGITGGTSANTFSPDSICTRAQVVTFLHRMIASPEPAAITLPFADVKTSDYFYKPVKWAYGSKITGGTSDTTFSPDETCSRAQVVTFLWRTAGQPEAKSNKCNFTDVKSDSYYYKAVLWAVEQGITGGTSATTFSPDDSCTRGQVVTFLYRFINKQ